MIKFTLNAAPKPTHNRAKPKRGNVTRITPKVREEVNRRSMELLGVDVPVCERCGYSRDLTKAHLINASQGGEGGVPWNIANICGTHGTKQCHDWIDNTQAGRDWKLLKAYELQAYYTEGPGAKHWKMEV